jgi:hypothetical protein
MRVKNNTQRFQAFVQDLQESFWGDFQGRTRELLERLLESDAEQQMADYLGLKWHERAGAAERVDCRNGFYERDYVTPLGRIRLRIPRTRQRSFLPPLDRAVGAALAGSGPADPAGLFAGDFHAPGGAGGGRADRGRGECPDRFANLPVTPNSGLDRPVVDQTGLTGNFDFLLKFSPQPPDGGRLQREDYQPAFLEALKEQLGVKLNSVTAPVDSFVIDNIEEPSAN